MTHVNQEPPWYRAVAKGHVSANLSLQRFPEALAAKFDALFVLMFYRRRAKKGSE